MELTRDFTTKNRNEHIFIFQDDFFFIVLFNLVFLNFLHFYISLYSAVFHRTVRSQLSVAASSVLDMGAGRDVKWMVVIKVPNRVPYIVSNMEVEGSVQSKGVQRWRGVKQIFVLRMVAG